MKLSRNSPFIFIVCFAMAGASLAFGQSKPKENRFGLFKDAAYSLDPEIENILQLTPEQVSKLEAARTAFLEDEEVKQTREAFQADNQNSEAKGAFYSAEKKAVETYRQIADETLTGAQLERILAVNELAESTWKELQDIEHWGERTKKMKEIGPERLVPILTPGEISLLGLGPAAPAP